MSGTVNMSAPGVQTSSAPTPSARAGQRFPRTNKLLKHALFDRVYQLGQRHFSGLVTVFFLSREPGSGTPAEKVSSKFEGSSEAGAVGPGPLNPTADLNRAPATVGPRIGLTVGRVLGNSVVRNRIRRRMREAVRMNLHRFNGPVDVVINPKKAVLTAEFDRITEEVRKAFEAVAKRAEDSCRDGSPTRPDGAKSRPRTGKGRGGAARQFSKRGGVE